MRIIVKGLANASTTDLAKLDGIDCQDNFTSYFDNDFTYIDAIEHGYLCFSFENDKLYSVTEYNSNRKLSDDELASLKRYTIAQWSDGIGEGFEQEPCAYGDNNDEIFISAWVPNENVSITQYNE